MIVKSYEVQKNLSNLLKYNFFLLYGENVGLKKDIIESIKISSKKNDDSIEILSFYENEILENEENLYNSIYSGSLFGSKKIVNIYEASDKIFKKISDICDKDPANTCLIISSNILDKKSKLRNFFEKNTKTVCIPCYLDSEKDLAIIAYAEFRKNKITLPKEAINILVEKSNADRNNLKNEIEKIKAYTLNKKNLDLDEIKKIINFSGDYKSDILVNECLCGNILQYKKILSEIYVNAVNQILLLRILNNKIQRLLKIKEQESESNNLDNIINTSKPAIFWKEKSIVKKQLSIWTLEDLKKMIDDTTNAELECKKNPQISKIIFFNFFTQICKKASNYS